MLHHFIMVALCNWADHYIFALWFLSFFLLSFFFPRLISAAIDWMSTILPHMVWPQCEFKTQVWNLLHAARWKCRMQKIRQKSPSEHHRTTLSGSIFATKAHIDNRKKLVKHWYVLHMSPQYGELRPTNGWDRSGSLRHSCKFQQVSRLGSVTAQHLVVGVSQLCGVEQRAPPVFVTATITLGIVYICIFMRLTFLWLISMFG